MTWAAAKKAPREEKKKEQEEVKKGGEWKPTRGNNVWAEDKEEAFVRTLVYKVCQEKIFFFFRFFSIPFSFLFKPPFLFSYLLPSPSFSFLLPFLLSLSLSTQVNEDEVETETAGIKSPHQCFPINPPTQDGVPDHTMMDFLHDPNLLHNIQHRYENDDIYSYIAYILIAVNPYKTLPIYTEEEMWKYRKVCYQKKDKYSILFFL